MAENLKVINKPIRQLLAYINNVKIHDEENVNEIAESIKAFGFCNPVLIDIAGEIIAGHGRVLACKMLGFKKVPCIVLAHLSPQQRNAYRIADNRLTEKSKWNIEALTAELDALAKEDYNLELTGLTEKEIKALLEKDPLAGETLETPTIVRTHKRTSKGPGGEEKKVFEIVIEFTNQRDQDQAYKDLKGTGYKCRLIRG